MEINPDAINGTLEAIGAFFTMRHCMILWRDRGDVRGVYWPAWIFFSLWGLWNLFYYPKLGQPLSFYGGILLVSGNIAWLTIFAYWRARRVR